MKAQNRIRTASLLLTALFASTAAAQDFSTARAARQVLVSIPDRKLVVLEGGKVVRAFPVAVGAMVSPSPSGEFKVVNRIAKPTYYHPGVVIPAGDAIAIIAGMAFSLTVALLVEELIFGKVFRLIFARQAVAVKSGRVR